MKKSGIALSSWAILAALTFCTPLYAADNPFLGRWALTIPGGGAGWLGVTQENGYLDASLLWGGGSVLPVDCVFVGDGDLYVMRVSKVERKDAAGKVVRTQMFPEVIRAELRDDALQLTQTTVRRDGSAI